MASFNYRELEPGEAGLFSSIDRAESVSTLYQVKNGKLVEKAVQHEIVSWNIFYDGDVLHTNPDGPLKNIQIVQQYLTSGSPVFGAFDKNQIAGIAALDISPVGGNPEMMRLDQFFVSTPYRGHGVGRSLTDRIVKEARRRGSTSLYISSIPTKSTVDAYLHMGAHVLDKPDPRLFEMEPEDIHLVLKLSDYTKV